MHDFDFKPTPQISMLPTAPRILVTAKYNGARKKGGGWGIGWGEDNGPGMDGWKEEREERAGKNEIRREELGGDGGRGGGGEECGEERE